MARANVDREQATGAGGMIAAVAEGSPAERAGLRAGMRVLGVDGVAVTDVLDLLWRADGPEHSFSIAGPSGATSVVRIERGHGEPWGFDFASPLFDAVKTCENACAFCFVSQLPRGLRPSLYVRDDDYRLSFLFGNFVTLTNLTDAERDRIIEQRLSPLYVSVHAVKSEVRDHLIGPGADRGLARLVELLGAGIEIHAQIVLVPGVNDAGELDRTLEWLARYEGVVSVGVVPVGYTRHQHRIRESFLDADRAAAVIAQVQRWQRVMRDGRQSSWVHAADEFYINSGLPFPAASVYEGFPQYENGIGIARSFIDEARGLASDLAGAVGALPEGELLTVVTGTLAASTLAGALAAIEAAGRVRLLVVENGFFGGNVSVTGLLTGEDIVRAIGADPARQKREGVYLVPDVVLNDDGLTLDGVRADELGERSGADVRVVSSDAHGLLAGIREAASSLASERASRRV